MKRRLCLFVLFSLGACSVYVPPHRPPGPLDVALPPIAHLRSFDPCPGPVPAVLELDCSSSDIRAWQMTLAGHDVFVAITRTKGETTWQQRRVAIDHVRYIELPPAYWFLDDMPRLDLGEADAQALLEVIAMTGTSRPGVELPWTTAFTQADADALAQRVPRAAGLIAEKAPGFGRDATGWHMRVYTFSALANAVSRVELSIIDGEVVLHPVETR
jgi:hypothetical protein